MAVHRRLYYPHATSAAVVYGGRGYWTNGQRICLTRSRKTLLPLIEVLRLPAAPAAGAVAEGAPTPSPVAVGVGPPLALVLLHPAELPAEDAVLLPLQPMLRLNPPPASVEAQPGRLGALGPVGWAYGPID